MTADVIHADQLPPEVFASPNVGSTSSPRRLLEVVEEAEKSAVSVALAASEYHREPAAKLLGISVRTLHYKMSRYGLH